MPCRPPPFLEDCRAHANQRTTGAARVAAPRLPRPACPNRACCMRPACRTSPAAPLRHCAPPAAGAAPPCDSSHSNQRCTTHGLVPPRRWLGTQALARRNQRGRNTGGAATAPASSRTPSCPAAPHVHCSWRRVFVLHHFSSLSCPGMLEVYIEVYIPWAAATAADTCCSAAASRRAACRRRAGLRWCTRRRRAGTHFEGRAAAGLGESDQAAIWGGAAAQRLCLLAASMAAQDSAG